MRETYTIQLPEITQALRNKILDMLAGAEIAVKATGAWSYLEIAYHFERNIVIVSNDPNLVASFRREFSNFGIDIVKGSV